MGRNSVRPRRPPVPAPPDKGVRAGPPGRRTSPPAGGEWETPQPAPTRQSAGAGWTAVLGLLAMAVIIAGVATLGMLELWLGDRIIPGVYVWDVDVGGLTREEATARLAANFHYPVDRSPILRYGDQTWPIAPADLGVQPDLTATVNEALAVGHQSDLVERVKEQVSVLLGSRLVVPIFATDPGMGTMVVSRLTQGVNQPLRNATLSLGDNLEVVIIPGQAGHEVDAEATRQALVRRIEEMAGGEVELVVQETEPALTDLSTSQARAQRILSGPITLTAPESGPWTIEPKTLAGWLILQPMSGDDGKAMLSVNLDRGQTTRLAEEIAAQVERAPTDARFRFDDASGMLVAVTESVPGQTLDITATVAEIEGAAQSDQRTVSLPLIPVRPAIATEDAAALGISELIGEGVTKFAGSSASRVKNITVGAAQFDGVLVPPGETFSFNEALGEVTAEKGYEEGIIIWGNTTRADVGGGLCQVSSTAFRAAFWAGLPITERWAHAFRVSYYEPPLGMDATIYSPSVDLKWANDTGHYILIQTYVDTDKKTLTFRYYGTNPGRTVELDGPYESNPVSHGAAVYREDPTLPKGETKQIEWAKDGLDVKVYRIIKENGAEVQRDTFFSRYRPWQAVFLVGTKEG